MRSAESPLTLMAVHAHPDDEASTTGGILAKYAGEGIRTILVTCTNGELGDAPGGAKPGEEGHDEQAVVALRRRELEESCRILGVRHLELLGYRDSGMMGWPSNELPEAFWTIPVEEAASSLAQLMSRYRPDVVVTYDANGFYGHPDHIQAHRVTRKALAIANISAKLYFPALRRSRFGVFRERLAQAGLDLPDVDEDQLGSPDEEIAASIDCRAQAESKFAALGAHSSQEENIVFLRLPRSDFSDLFGVEEFVRLEDATGNPVLEHDLFAGLRDPEPR